MFHNNVYIYFVIEKHCLPFKFENNGGVNCELKPAKWGGKNNGGCPLSKCRKLLSSH